MKRVIIVGVLGAAALLAGCGEKESGAVDAAEATSPTGAEVAREGRGSAAEDQVHRTTGRVVGLTGTTITLDHQPVDSLNWPAMSMAFQVPQSAMLEGVEVGSNVRFAFKKEGAGYVLTELERQ